MHPQVAFVLYLAVSCIFLFMFLLLCVRVSVYIEDTCPTRFCVRRQQRKVRKKLIRRILYPDEPDPDSPRPPSPSEENITADIICQPYIYHDAYSTGLTGLRATLATLPFATAPADHSLLSGSTNSNNNAEQNMRILYRRLLSSRNANSTSLRANGGEHDLVPVSTTNPHHATDNEELPSDEIQTNNNDMDDLESLPPAYAHVANNANVSSDLLRLRMESETGRRRRRGSSNDRLEEDNLSSTISLSDNEPPPPSYYECVGLSFPLPPTTTSQSQPEITTTTTTSTTTTNAAIPNNNDDVNEDRGISANSSNNNTCNNANNTDSSSQSQTDSNP